MTQQAPGRCNGLHYLLCWRRCAGPASRRCRLQLPCRARPCIFVISREHFAQLLNSTIVDFEPFMIGRDSHYSHTTGQKPTSTAEPTKTRAAPERPKRQRPRALCIRPALRYLPRPFKPLLELLRHQRSRRLVAASAAGLIVHRPLFCVSPVSVVHVRASICSSCTGGKR